MDGITAVSVVVFLLGAAACWVVLYAVSVVAKVQDEQAEQQYQEQLDMEKYRRLTDDL